ncbi:glycosyltransferase family 4 protein [Nostoc commune]|uniref:glycosyltransferase family 4 protein n=1 Tax=Nostoc commune TaxID=1178 RepID=UPI0018C66555|nr:glycosyltransferase family 4 protein [Nostoc commune]MBG1260436.1 glycosyltransferase family 4 protein [Nostoc commune BAE]
MKILIVSTFVPFIDGGGVFIVDWLGDMLRKHGYQTDIIKLPFHSYYPEMLEQMLALKLLDLADFSDLLITIRTPSYILEHPNKVLWFIHHHRGAYDLWGTMYQDIPSSPEGLKIKEGIINADNVAFKEAKKIYTNSQIVSQRLKKFNNFDSEVLYPPLMEPEKYYCSGYEDYIFYPSRITHHKRQHLAIQSMKYTKSSVKLIIAGKSESMDYLNYLNSIIKENNLENKVTIIDQWISQEKKIELFANALAGMYIPFDEDSYGYVSLESYHAQKSVITCADSGGTLELIDNCVNGFVVNSLPESIADVMDKLYYNKTLAKQMGKAGLDKLLSMNISWENVVQKLVT